MNAFGQTVCLNMIVKNEAGVMERCLNAVRPIVDHWVIVDTGSTDGTQEIIRKVFAGVPGELHERPWVNFAHNRSEALRLASGHGDYVFVIDADEVLEIASGFTMPKLTADSYNLNIRYGGCTYLRKQLVKNTLPWRYEGVLHEYITCEAARSEEFLAGLETVPHHDGARARDANTYRRDALILEKALIDEPNNSRYVFYLAQSYRDAGDLELAQRHYARRVAMGGWREEAWYSLYQIAVIAERMQKPWTEVMEAYLAAWQYQPDRAGPLYRIAMHYQAKAQYHTSHLFLERAMRVPHPSPNRLFVERPVYEYHLPLEYAVASYYVGDHAASIRTNNALLRSGMVPAHAVDQVIRNRRYSVDALAPKGGTVDPPEEMLIAVMAHPAGPEVDDCIEALARQEDTRFRAVFFSPEDLTARFPAGDARFVWHRAKAAGMQTAMASRVRQSAPQTVVVALAGGYRLGEAGTLGEIRKVFGNAAVKLAYGQFRTAEGALGDAEPAPDAMGFADTVAGREHPCVAFRRELMASGGADWQRQLFAGAGFAHCAFSDSVWTAARAVAGQAPAAPAILKGQLPLMSCLMVTQDRLALAKRAIDSYAVQSYPNRELLIVTDGEERFRRALERYVASLGLDSVRFEYPEGARRTLGEMRNLSFDAARGELLCQWDDDDLSHPERLLTQAGQLLREDADACLMTDHLQFIEEKRVVCWIDWSFQGEVKGPEQYAPGTLMIRRQNRVRYPESGPFASRGEDSILLEALCRQSRVASLTGAGQLYLYTYHGRNTFPREHHYRLANCRTTAAHLNENAPKIREALRHYAIQRPCFVIGKDGPAFAIQ